MNKSPLVSILMPVYNAGRFLRIAIDGILAQTYRNFEFIIINDGSTDDSEQIIKSYTDTRIIYLNQDNQGVARTLNNGLKICKGKYVRRHDADDLSTPNSLKEQVEFMNKHEEYPLISSRIAYMTENNQIAKNYTNPTNIFFNNAYFIEITESNYWRNRPIIHATVMAKKSLFDEFKGYRKAFPTSEDIDLWLRIIEKYKVAVVNSTNYFVRLHKLSNTKVYGIQNEFYRNLAYTFYQERKEKGADLLMRGEPMPKPPQVDNSTQINIEKVLAAQKKMFREDILGFQYKIFVDAKDWKLVCQSIKIALKDGWKLKKTWKAIIFPLLGKKFVKFGVTIKSIFKNRKN